MASSGSARRGKKRECACIRAPSTAPHSSSAKARDAKTKILFIKHALNEDSNQILKTIISKELETNKTEWSKNALKYIIEFKINLQMIITLDKEKKINEIEEKNWKDQMKSKSSLSLYRTHKNKIEEIKWFKNGYKFNILMRARANALDLNWRNSDPAEKRCNLCLLNEETLKHFVLECPKLQNSRNRFIELQLPRIQNESKILNKLLMFETNSQLNPNTCADILLHIWQCRNNLIKETNA